MAVLVDAAGRRRSPATMPGHHAGRPPRNKDIRYPADPPTVNGIVTVMRHISDDGHGWRLRAMIVVLWRAALLVRRGKGGRRREVGMDAWGWEQVRRYLSARRAAGRGVVLRHRRPDPGRGRPGVRTGFRRVAVRAARVRRRFAPHQLRHAHALELAREGVPLNIIQRQLGHTNPGTTSIYLQGDRPGGDQKLSTRSRGAGQEHDHSSTRAAEGCRGRRRPCSARCAGCGVRAS